jgi:hypothetical protein
MPPQRRRSHRAIGRIGPGNRHSAVLEDDICDIIGIANDLDIQVIGRIFLAAHGDLIIPSDTD